LALARLELDLRALGERLEAATEDLRMVDEEILPAFVGRDEAVPLRVVEPLDGSGCHENTSLTKLTNGQGGRERHRYSFSISLEGTSRAGRLLRAVKLRPCSARRRSSTSTSTSPGCRR